MSQQERSLQEDSALPEGESEQSESSPIAQEDSGSGDAEPELVEPQHREQSERQEAGVEEAEPGPPREESGPQEAVSEMQQQEVEHIESEEDERDAIEMQEDENNHEAVSAQANHQSQEDQESRDMEPEEDERNVVRSQEDQNNRWNSRNEAETGRLAEELAERLQNASTVLLDRLFEHLSHLPSEETSDTASPTGLSLPASAIGWLSTQLYPHIDSEQESSEHALWMGSAMRDRLSLLKFLLPRVTHVRVTSDEWPPPRPTQYAATSPPHNFVGQDVNAADDLSVHSTLTMESLVPPRPTLRGFLVQYYLLQNRPRVNLQLFPRLRVLLMDRVPPEWVVNLNVVRSSLELIRTERGCIYNVGDFLFSNEEEVYERLTHLKLQNCSIGELSGLRGKRQADERVADDTQSNEDENDGHDEKPHAQLKSLPPLSRLPNLLSLSLAHNEIRSVRTALAGLAALPRLKRLDLSYNHLSHLKGAHTMLGNVKVLLLTGNQLTTVQGLDRLYSLEHLALDENNLCDLASVAGLANLPELKSLKLAENPVTRYHPKRYRVEVLSLFRERRYADLPYNATYRQVLQVLPLLDGKAASKTELVGVRGLAFSQTVVDTMEKDDWVQVCPSQDEVETSTPTGNGEPLEFASVMSPILTSERKRRVSRRGKPRRVVFDEEPRFVLHRPMDNGGSISPARLKDDSIMSSNMDFSLSDVIATLPNLAPVAADDDDGSSEMTPEQETNGVAKHSYENGDVSQAFGSDNGGGSSEMSGRSIPLQNTPTRQELSFVSLSTVEKANESAENNVMNGDENDKLLEDLASETTPRSPCRTVDVNGNEDLVADTDERKSYAAERVEGVNGSTLAALMEMPDGGDEEENAAVPGDAVQDTNATRSDVQPTDNFGLVPQIPQVVFPENVWDDDHSALSSLKTSTVDHSISKSKFQEVEEECTYDGPEHQKGLPVTVNLDMYFRYFVFRVSVPSSAYREELSSEEKSELMLGLAPRIQLRPIDWRALETIAQSQNQMEILSSVERFDSVWREQVLACGKPAAKRVSPYRKPRRGFHGDVLFSNGKLEKKCECRNVIICTSDKAIYFISDYDAVTRNQLSKSSSRRFPLPIPEDALFEHGHWPHSLARHPIMSLDRITIGFGFQRLTLHFISPPGELRAHGSNEYAYILLTCSKMKTVNCLQHLQGLAKDFRSRASAEFTGEALKIDNDDKQVLDALAVAVAPNAVGMVLHYQIVQQRWEHGDRGTVRRACIVTDSKLFLLDEDYVGDGSESFEAGARGLSEVRFKMVDSADVEQITEAQSCNDDPNSVTIVIRPLSRLQRYHRWRLVCHDRDGAERLVDNVRKAMDMAS